MSKLKNGPGKVNHCSILASLPFTEHPIRLPLKNAIQQRALRTLKQKKMYEAQMAQIQQQTFNMELFPMNIATTRVINYF